MSFSGNLLCKSKFVSLFHNFGNEYQSWPHKKVLSEAEFCGRCSSIAAALRHRELVFLLLVLL